MMVLVFLIVGVGFSWIGDLTSTPEQRVINEAARQHQIEMCTDQEANDCVDMSGS
jgi:hypothetical protein